MASAGGQFAKFMSEKAGVNVAAVIKRYDGRPFEPTELAREIETAIG